jgi:pimeloyl-ACP methyl ester carboxylesterase
MWNYQVVETTGLRSQAYFSSVFGANASPIFVNRGPRVYDFSDTEYSHRTSLTKALHLKIGRRFMFDFQRFGTSASIVIILFAAISPRPLLAQQVPALHPKYTVQFFRLQVENQDLRMAYRDVQPTGASNGKVVLLLHGKNFSGFYWEPTIEFLTRHGYRVIAPDQLGFGASSRPDIHYSFHQMAQNTKALLDRLGIQQVDVIAHSMGGMLGVRFTLLFPETVEKLVLENPIGLEDYRKLVPYIPLQQQYAAELSQTYEKMRDYQKTYYPAAWKPEYEIYVQDQASVLDTGDYPRDAWSSALTYEMIYEQAVVYELGEISRPTLLIIGQTDRTVVGKNRLPPGLQSVAGQYPELGRKTQAAIKGSTLVEIPDCGHIPHIQKPEQFRNAVVAFLAPPSSR